MSRGSPGLAAVAALLLLCIYGTVLSSGADTPELVLADGDHYVVTIPGLDFDSQSPEHARYVEILKARADALGFGYVGRAGTLKGSAFLRSKDALRVVRSSESSGIASPGEAVAGELCSDLNALLRTRGLQEAECLHTPWRDRAMRTHPSDGQGSSFDYLLRIPGKMFSSKGEVHHSAPSPRYPISPRSPDLTLDKVLLELGINDPMFRHQWHLVNSDNEGHDLHVVPVWKEGVTGEGVTVAIIDDGVDFTHPDLQEAESRKGSVDLTGESVTRKEIEENGLFAHGTRCAGEVAARPNNVCGVGVAYGSSISSIRLIGLSSKVTDAHEASSVSYVPDINHIYACSWGPTDDGRVVEGPGRLTASAIEHNIEHGRDGLGSVYVFASGNGLRQGDDCNYDGYVNSIYTITISSIDMYDTHPPYSEECSANLAVTYSGLNGSSGAIVTSDIRGGCKFQTGTSASAPLAAGIYALALQVRPDLSWRDIQQLTVLTAVPVSLNDNSWVRNSVGLLYSNKFGYGKLRADHAVELAKKITKLRPLTALSITSPSILGGSGRAVSLREPRYHTSIKFQISEAAALHANIAAIEQVTVTLSVVYPIRGMLEYFLISPRGTHTKLASVRPRDHSNTGLDSWTFSTVALWGEDVVGSWEFIVAPTDILRTRYFNENKDAADSFREILRKVTLSGKITEVSFKFYGEVGRRKGSTFLANIESAKSVRPYRHEVSFDSSTPSNYVFNEKEYRKGYAVSGSDGYGSQIDYAAIVVSVIILAFVVILASYFLIRRRNNLRDARSQQQQLLNSNPPNFPAPPHNYPVDYSAMPTREEPYGMFPGGLPPPNYTPPFSGAVSSLNTYSYPYQEPPPGYVFGSGDYQKVLGHGPPGSR